MKYSNIGGQAVMEGVMMRNGDKYAVAVRTVDGEIVVKTDTYTGPIKNKKVQKLPIVRGVVNFIDSLVLGMKSLMFSADFFAEETSDELEERLGKEEKKVQKKAEALKAKGKTEEANKVLEKFAKEAAEQRAHVNGRTGEDVAAEDKKEDNSLLMGLTVAFSLVLSVGLFMMLPYFLSTILHNITSSQH